ncbi:uncharacterized protein J4E88_011025, partial [Alternaria novae-zelandiae]|uniref:uncharacterized protein n=1 Tax=Alternaria novae-zelandiae TaxID=430562 RepID=UPI0020C55172
MDMNNRRDRCRETLPSTLFEEFVQDDVRTLRTWLTDLFLNLGLYNKPMPALCHLGTADKPLGLILGCIAGNKLLRMPLIVKERAGDLVPGSQEYMELVDLRVEKKNLYAMLGKVDAHGKPWGLLEWEKDFLERAADDSRAGMWLRQFSCLPALLRIM